MAEININELINHVDTLKEWLKEGESPARECTVIRFTKGQNDPVVDKEMANETLYLQSRDGNVTIEFDKSGLIKYIEVS